MAVEEVKKAFRKNGFRLTSQRLSIYQFLVTREDHPTAMQIYKALEKVHPTISLGTIYKSLHLLKELGLLQELGFNDDVTRYDPDLEPHVNLVCSKCGEIQDYKTQSLTKHWEAILSEIPVKAAGQRIDIYYECEKCKN
jgi:Fur family peroxide stress response transcriptional regulator